MRKDHVSWWMKIKTGFLFIVDILLFVFLVYLFKSSLGIKLPPFLLIFMLPLIPFTLAHMVLCFGILLCPVRQ